MKLLEGNWELVSFDIQGQRMQLPQEKNRRKLVIKDGKATLVIAAQTIHTRWRVDPTRSPKTLDITYENGELKGKTGHAIYELNGDDLRECISNSGEVRPPEFASAPGSDCAILTYKRDKP
jgi:uncharacterized protein (TIGR03067 family)